MATRKKPGRNDPCPCGSGKKYKHCCLGSEQGGGPHFMTRWLVLGKAEKPAEFPAGAEVWTRVRLQLPFWLPGVSGEGFDVPLDDATTAVAVTEHFRSPEYVKEVLGFEPKGTQLWLSEDPYGRAMFSEAHVLLPGQLMLAGSSGWLGLEKRSSGDEGMRQLEKLEARELGKALRPVNALIERHALVTGTHWTRHVKPHHVSRYWYAYRQRPDGPDIQETVVALAGRHELHAGRAAQTVPRAQIAALRASLLAAPELPVEKRLLLSAKRMLAEADARLAVLELAIALEAGVDKYLRAFCLGRGVSDSEFERMTAELGLRLAIDTLLPIACPVELPRDEIDTCHGLLTLRNKIIHEAWMEISEGEVSCFVTAVEALLDFLEDNPPTAAQVVKAGNRT
jgi:hypothetical protein